MAAVPAGGGSFRFGRKKRAPLFAPQNFATSAAAAAIALPIRLRRLCAAAWRRGGAPNGFSVDGAAGDAAFDGATGPGRGGTGGCRETSPLSISSLWQQR